MTRRAGKRHLEAVKLREEALVELVDALDRLLACYRVGSTPREELLDRIGQLRAEVAR